VRSETSQRETCRCFHSAIKQKEPLHVRVRQSFGKKRYNYVAHNTKSLFSFLNAFEMHALNARRARACSAAAAAIVYVIYKWKKCDRFQQVMQPWSTQLHLPNHPFPIEEINKWSLSSAVSLFTAVKLEREQSVHAFLR